MIYDDTFENLSEVWYTKNGTRTLAYEYEYTSDGQLYSLKDNVSDQTTVYDYDLHGRLKSYRIYKNSDAEKSFKAVLKQQPGNGEAAYELALLLSADEKRRKEAGEFYMLAKSNGIAVDSYLEELLRSFSTHDQATRNFLLSNAADAMLNSDMQSASWYLSEVKKLYPNDQEYIAMQAVYYIMNKQSLEILKLFGKNADNRQKLLCSIALMLNEKYADAEKMLSATTKLSTGALPEALTKFIRKTMEGSTVNTPGFKLCEKILQKLR